MDDPLEASEEEYFKRKEGQRSVILWTSRVKAKYLENIRLEFKIPEDILLLVPEEHEWACFPSPMKVTFNRASVNGHYET